MHVQYVGDAFPILFCVDPSFGEVNEAFSEIVIASAVPASAHLVTVGGDCLNLKLKHNTWSEWAVSYVTQAFLSYEVC